MKVALIYILLLGVLTTGVSWEAHAADINVIIKNDAVVHCKEINEKPSEWKCTIEVKDNKK